MLVWDFQGETVADTRAPSINTTTLKGVDKQSRHPLFGGSVNSIVYTHRSFTGTKAMAPPSLTIGKKLPQVRNGDCLCLSGWKRRVQLIFRPRGSVG